MEQLHGAFTLMDMESGFHQVRVALEDQHKTAFHTWFGHFEFNIMPFGLKGAPGTFQTIMNSMLMDHVEVCCPIYLDDVLIYNPDLDTHIKDVAAVLSALKANKLYPKICKCRFAQQRLDIESWPEQRNSVTEVLQVLGLVNFVRMWDTRNCSALRWDQYPQSAQQSAKKPCLLAPSQPGRGQRTRQDTSPD